MRFAWLKRIRRHHRTLTFIGGLIVFGTFIVKDAIRENLRDLSDSIRSAQTAFAQSVTASESFAAHARIERKINSISDQERLLSCIVSRPSSDERSVPEGGIIPGQCLYGEPENEYFAMTDDNIHTAEVVLSSTEELYEKLPPKDEISVSLQNIKSQHDAALKRFDEAAKKGTRFNVDQTTTDPALVFPLVDAQKAVAGLQDTLNNLVQAVLDHANVTRERDEKRYSMATWASYVLYALGWGLGLLGRLIHVEIGIGAANWIQTGTTTGRSRQDSDHTLQVPLKDVYVYPLGRRFRQELCP